MERDILRIQTLPNGNRIGLSLSSEYEKKNKDQYSDLEEKIIDEVSNNLATTKYELDNVEDLQDGDYPFNLFQQIFYAAHIVPEGQPIPISTAPPLL